ncbi:MULTISPECIES: hypothetical protein [Ralstonia solanacearum species complex]|nr:hypothetical protein [Ralstonia solanacearum]
MEQFDAKPIEIKALFSNALEPVQAAARQDKCWPPGSRSELRQPQII